MSLRDSGSCERFFAVPAPDVQTLEMAWGVDIEPTLAMVSMAFGKYP